MIFILLCDIFQVFSFFWNTLYTHDTIMCVAHKSVVMKMEQIQTLPYIYTYITIIITTETACVYVDSEKKAIYIERENV